MAPHKLSGIVTEALLLCTKTIIPSLFPFLILSQFFSRTGIAEKAGRCLSFLFSKPFGLDKELCGAFLTGNMFGFPNGAITAGISYSKGKCSKFSAQRAIAVSSNCSIPFVFSVIGAYTFKSVKAAFIIYLSEILSVLLMSVVLKILFKKPKNDEYYLTNNCTSNNNKNDNLLSILCKSISEAGISMLNICAFISAFCVIAEILFMFFQNVELSSYLKGFFEITAGADKFSKLSFPGSVVIASAAIGFTGLSALFQVINVCRIYKLSANQYIASRFLCLIFMPIITSCLLMILPNKVIPVGTFTPEILITEGSFKTLFATVLLYAALLCVVMICFAFVYSIIEIYAKVKKKNNFMF